ncbi:MAG: hypothetical protein ACP5H3_00750 [Candidatus Aenigmatarchaeota archaeon]
MEEREVREKIQKGWILSKAWFDVLAVSKEAAEESLKKHIEKLKKLENCIVVKEDYKETLEVEKPLPNVEKGFSKAVEIEILTKDIETLLSVTIFFAPSAVEVLEPESLKISSGSIQTIMNTVADLIHKFAAQGIGGVVIAKS